MGEEFHCSSTEPPGSYKRVSVNGGGTRVGGLKRKSDWESSGNNTGTEDSGGSWAISEIENEPFAFFWIIKNFTAVCKGTQAFESPVFKGGDSSNHSWQLLIDPTETRGSLGFNLKLVEFGDLIKGEEDRKINVRFEISVPRADGNVPMKIDGPESDVYPFGKGVVWGPSIGIATLQNVKGLVKNDTIKIQLRGWIVGKWKHVSGGEYGTELDLGEEMETVKKRRSFKLVSDISSLYEEPVFPDATLLIGSKRFPVHKAILAARSVVFKAMFASPLKESSDDDSAVEISDFDENIVKSMLEFIYTGEARDLKESATDLIRIANKYQIEELKQECELIIAQNLSIENASEILVLADLYNAESLKDKVSSFIKRNKKEVFKTDSFKIASDAQPKLFLEIAYSD